MDDRKPLRRLHLPGGLRIDHLPPEKGAIFPIGKNADEVPFDAETYETIAKDVKLRVGLPILGCEFIRDKDELEGLCQSDWRAIVPRRKKEWPTHLAELNWSGLANAARKKRDARLFLVAGSIKSQLRFSSMRLLDLSQRYLAVLISLLRRESTLDEGHAYRNNLDSALFSSVHASFFEMATLRDYLGEYIARVLYSEETIDNFRDLHRLISRADHGSALENEIKEIYAEGGWLRQFTDRRNTLAHRLPFDRASYGAVAMYVKKHNFPVGGTAWLLHVPVPKPVPFDHRASCTFAADEDEEIRLMWDEIKIARDREDTLVYLFGVFERLVDLGNRLFDTFPYEPQMLTLTDKDIIEFSFHKTRNKRSVRWSGST